MLSHAASSARKQPASPYLSRARAILYELFGPPHQRSFAIELWDGSSEWPAGRTPVFTLIIRHPGALRRMLLPPSELALAEAYLRGDFDIAGELSAAIGLADQIARRLRSPGRLVRLASALRALPSDDLPAAEYGAFRHHSRPHSRQRDAAAIRHHYDVSNDFYALWLDRQMIYTCGYFPNGNESLDEAQTAKLDLICRKLRLRPNDRLLDIGCGWGGLMIYAASHYGVSAIGITLSEAQAELARSRIAAAGLSGRCQVEICDYRDLPRSAVFDKVVSVEMFEAVGRSQMDAYFAAAYRHTRPGGLFLNQGIVWTAPRTRGPLAWARAQLWQELAFMRTYIFPDGELISSGESLSFAEQAGFEPRDLENLREHYVLTLDHWLQRLDARRDTAVALVGEQTYRAWRLYLAGSCWHFRVGTMSLVQMLFARQDAHGQVELPRIRNDLYTSPPLERGVGTAASPTAR